ncbi:MAG: hydrogenase subunit MbhD domain-containing protein [Bacteroidales bacterium]
MSVTIFFALLLAILTVIMAVAVLVVKKISTAVLVSGVVSLVTSIIYLLLASPDVAMTEAAIGSGLTTIIFFYVLNKMRSSDV